jgi:hypothetical protein
MGAIVQRWPNRPAPLWLAQAAVYVFKNLLQNNMMAALEVFFSTVSRHS